MKLNEIKVFTEKPLYKNEIAEMLSVSNKTLARWVRNARTELGFSFGREKILNVEKSNKILSMWL